jgi:DNA-binding transcriptional regulator YdaS (Cro superfamily)
MRQLVQAGQTASDIFETQILFGASKIGQLLGVSPKNLANKSAEEVEKLAKESLLKTIAKGTARGASRRDT